MLLLLFYYLKYCVKIKNVLSLTNVSESVVPLYIKKGHPICQKRSSAYEVRIHQY
jgi:hypothetical protein